MATPLVLRREDAERLLGQLKRRCGAGGTLKLERDASGEPCFTIEVQGDQVGRVLELLGEGGYRVGDRSNFANSRN